MVTAIVVCGIIFVLSLLALTLLVVKANSSGEAGIVWMAYGIIPTVLINVSGGLGIILLIIYFVKDLF